MTQEDKQLLLRDLCARLPYELIVLEKAHKYGPLVDEDYRLDCFASDEISVTEFIMQQAECIKPYLRPMSSMTPDERFEYDELNHFYTKGLTFNVDEIDWLIAHHFDYRGLIPMGLALEAPEGMYNKEESGKGGEIPIPKTVDEAVKTLTKIVSEEDRDYLLENGAISVHNSMGRWIRNEWGLWTGSELKNELKKKGFEHPDDMSNYIIEEFIKSLS